MRKVELSIDEYNRPAAIRDALFDAMPEQCHGCPDAFETCYAIGQIARKGDMSPSEAADWAWGRLGACCQQAVIIENVPGDTLNTDERILLPV